MVVTIKIPLSDKEYQEAKKRKDFFRMTWREYLIKSRINGKDFEKLMSWKKKQKKKKK